MNESNPALTLALAMCFGMLVQVISRHIKLPGIVLLLGAGILLGPDMLGLVHPSSLGKAMHMIVGFAVAVILFEGGMNLRLSHIKREQQVIRQLITVGALVMAVGGVISSKFIIGWDWRNSILFGVLIIVTGPTVISPLLKRLRFRRSVSTVLEAEGVLLDAIGAVLAVVALEVALSPSGLSFVKGFFHIISRLLSGVIFGAAGGLGLALLLRIRRFIPESLENVFMLSMVFALFQISNTISAESGVVAVTIAGLVVGNTKTAVRRELRDFEEEMTVLLIGMLFILLAADVQIVKLTSLGWRGISLVLVIMFILRPLAVFAGTWGSELNLKQKTLLSWIAPRGIVAAAVASLFSIELEAHGFEGTQLQAMVFLLIILTVLQAGLTGGITASLLGLRKKTGTGWVILGVNPISRAIAKILTANNEDVLCIDENPRECKRAEKDGIRVLYGNGLDSNMLYRAEIDSKAGIIGMTRNEEVNYLFSKKIKDIVKLHNVLGVVKNDAEGVTTDMVLEMGGKIACGRAFDIEKWSMLLERGHAEIQIWKAEIIKNQSLEIHKKEVPFIPLVTVRDKCALPVDNTTTIKTGDQFHILIKAQKNDSPSVNPDDFGFTRIEETV
ncbi:MAG TPA: sodium:proton antiporter [Candidatus Marinimicrobia bacterium]|jgi:NhaP-type Na+/H+ or K+/H+ antiporter|nr:sodium:proton antiporter [Candidatus Neomarinimicrobiota bacterium]|tara:strand:- start:278 stop:2122 length:1845 start_codon:yes stop_codon:yes gene_type:complete